MRYLNIIPLLLLLSCNKPQPADEALHEMLNLEYEDYVARYGIENTRTPVLINLTRSGISKSDSLSVIKMDTLFTKEDLAYIFKQAKDTTSIKLNPKLLKGNITLATPEEVEAFWEGAKNKKDEIWQIDFKKHFGIGGYSTLNKPLFNKSHTVAILHMENECGYFCGSRHTLIYRKEKGKWKMIALINPGIV